MALAQIGSLLRRISKLGDCTLGVSSLSEEVCPNCVKAVMATKVIG